MSTLFSLLHFYMHTGRWDIDDALVSCCCKISCKI